MNGLTNTPAACIRNSLILATLSCVSLLYAVGEHALTSIAAPEQDADQTASISHPPLSPEGLGDVLLARRRYVEAIESYRMEPTQSSTLWNKLGIAQQHLLNEREARRDYERALNLNPKNAEATNNLATILFSEKDYGGAVRLYKRALKLSPQSSTIYLNLGTAFFSQGKYQKGAEAYRHALMLDPGAFEHDTAATIPGGTPPHQRAEMSYFLAKTYAEAGNTDQAIKYLRRALAQGFNDRKKIMSDKEFAALRETPEFRQMLTEEHLD